jgi:glycerol-1-phosphate dehydrogenase [NAD(P)+]
MYDTQAGDVSSMANMEMDCKCNHSHTVPIKKIITGSGALNRLEEILEDFRGARVYLVGDENTMPLARNKVCAILSAAGCDVDEHMFISPRGKHLILNEQLIGSMLIRMRPHTDLIVTIGSGTMNDLSRVISVRCAIPYIIIGTAPSMDGYASSTSPVVMDGGKKSIPLGTPYAIIGDVDLFRTAPDIMLAAGAGDILGKYIAIRDWKLAEREKEEYFCPYIADLVIETANRCANGLEQLFSRDEKVLQTVIDTLIMAGVAISMYGTSRPASGAEHQIAHYWEVAAINAGGTNSLHGNFVGLGTLVASYLYELAEQNIDLPSGDFMPSSEQIGIYLKALKGNSSIETLGITREVFRESLFHAAQPEIRYTILTYLNQIGKLEYYVDCLTEKFYGR